MSIKSTADLAILMSHIRHALSARFSLRNDKADDIQIDESLRAGVELRGATPWILMFAIFIASIGLNVNSTAVVIGAMLVSPLMGPIMGIGYGVGIYDFPLIRKSLLNLGIATLISLVTSTLYFLLTPLTAAQSELLSRTTPTIWDVLIALSGGLAGIVGATRKEKSNVIPGVAIATALMPPLCTAGYGLANGNWTFFFGAFYLFSINCVFIAFSTVIVIGFLRLPHRKFVDARVEGRVKKLLFTIVTLTTLPSCFLAYRLVGDEVFKNKARLFVRTELRFKDAHIAEMNIDPSQRQIEVTLIGEPVEKAVLQSLEDKLAEAGLSGASVVVHQTVNNRIDVASLKEGILGDLYRDSLKTLDERDKKIQKLQEELTVFSKQRTEVTTTAADIVRELKAQFPAIKNVVVGEGVEPNDTNDPPVQQVALLNATSNMPVSLAERARIERWFKARTKANTVRIVIEAPKLQVHHLRRHVRARKHRHISK